MEEVKKLQDFEKVRGKERLPTDTKPCIVKLLKDPTEWRNDNTIPFMIGVELWRVGQSEAQIESVLGKAGVKVSQLRGILRSVSSDRYKGGYGCTTLESESLCLYKHRNECLYYQAIPRKSQKPYRERDFWRYGWTRRLTAPEIVIYLAIREVEKKRRYPAGTRLYISRKELMKVSGRAQNTIIPSLERLKKKGLIKFKKGTQHRWYGKASEVKRIIPIPKEGVL